MLQDINLDAVLKDLRLELEHINGAIEAFERLGRRKTCRRASLATTPRPAERGSGKDGSQSISARSHPPQDYQGPTAQ